MQSHNKKHQGKGAKRIPMLFFSRAIWKISFQIKVPTIKASVALFRVKRREGVLFPSAIKLVCFGFTHNKALRIRTKKSQCYHTFANKFIIQVPVYKKCPSLRNL